MAFEGRESQSKNSAEKGSGKKPANFDTWDMVVLLT